MRYDEPGLIRHDIPEEDEIEVERPRGIRMGTFSPAFALDREEHLEHVLGGQAGQPDHRGVQEQGLRSADVDGNGLMDARDPEVFEHLPESGNGVVEVSGAIAEVAAERDRRSYSIQRVGRTSP